jgi:hypothetical protein
MSIIIYNNVYLSLEQIGSEFCFCISAYSLEVIGSKPIEFFLEYNPQDIIYEFSLYIYIYTFVVTYSPSFFL